MRGVCSVTIVEALGEAEFRSLQGVHLWHHVDWRWQGYGEAGFGEKYP